MRIEGLVAVVTGAASGLGHAVGKALLDSGAHVGLIDISEPTDLLNRSSAHFEKADVRNEASVARAIDAIATHFGRIDACINCAGVFLSRPVLSDEGVHPLAAFSRVIDINVDGTFAVLAHAASHMARNENNVDGECGAIVNVASIRAFDGGAGGAAYAASKGAVVSMTLALARDLAPRGIRVNCIAPGLMNTEMFHNLSPEAIASHVEKVQFPKRLGDPAEFAELALFLITNRYMNGETIRIDAGLRV